MNIYEDYINYMGEKEELINMLIDTNSSIYYVLTDVIKVTDHIYKLYEKR